MNRKEIKALAKEKIKGNKWNIWWPLLVIMALESILSNIFMPTMDSEIVVKDVSINVTSNISTGVSLSFIFTLIFAVIFAGYAKYIINFVRTGKFERKDIVNTIKMKWMDIVLAEILTSIIVFLCTLAFVVPGIIMGLAYTFAVYLVIDKDVKGNDSLKKSREMMKGYKWNYFVFILSFIGWAILTPFTLCILLIWLVPYFIVANTIYYDKLQQTNFKED